MAKQKGFLKIEGTLDDISFYKRGETFYIRNKGGVKKERILNDPAFKRTRENGSEFGTVAAASKLLRDGNAVLIKKAYDGKLNIRLMQVLSKVKNLDIVSARGQRQVFNGLGTAEGKALMKGFDFNAQAKLRSMLAAAVTLDRDSGKVTLPDLIPAEMLHYPLHATHVSLQSAVLRVDFEARVSEIAYSPVVNLPLDTTSGTVTLSPGRMPEGAGYLFYLLLVEFWQEVNGTLYALNNGSFNSLGVLDVV